MTVNYVRKLPKNTTKHHIIINDSNTFLTIHVHKILGTYKNQTDIKMLINKSTQNIKNLETLFRGNVPDADPKFEV